MRVALHVNASDKLSARDGPTARSVKSSARFGLHLMQMCAAMCISLGVLAALYFGAAAVVGFSTEAWQEAPGLSVLVVSVVLAGSMVVWMRLMRMEWRPTIEMAGTAIAAGALVVAGYWLGIVPLRDLLTSVCGVACVAMIGVMLFRVRLYSGHHAHAQ